VYAKSENRQVTYVRIAQEIMPNWNELFTEKENRWENVFEDVVDLVQAKTVTSDSRTLDLGCGAGRHLKYFSQNQIPVVGMDLAWNGLMYSRALLNQEQLPVNLTQSDMSEPLPFCSQSFDCVISIHVIFHNPVMKLKFTLSEIWRVLKPGGMVLLTFNTIYSHRFEKGIELEPGTWLPDSGIDKGIPHHFSSFDDLADLMKEFKVCRVNLFESSVDSRLSSHWSVLAQKPQGKI